MRKKLLPGIFALAVLLIAGYGMHRSMNSYGDLSDMALKNVLALADGEDPEDPDPGEDDEDSPFCYSGGPGSNSCSIDAGIEILGVGVAGGCSVSCNSGYYACCSLRCTCINEG